MSSLPSQPGAESWLMVADSSPRVDWRIPRSQAPSAKPRIGIKSPISCHVPAMPRTSRRHPSEQLSRPIAG